jgi:hypothetical protein
MSADYMVELNGALGVRMRVDFKTERREVADYSVVLLLEESERIETVRLYDGAHGQNELHRYTRQGGKQSAEIFHSGTLGAGMRVAIEAIKRGYQPMIESWRR